MLSKLYTISYVLLLPIFILIHTSHGMAWDVEEGAESNCICKLPRRPNFVFKHTRARWMVHSLNWAVLSTISTRLEFVSEKTEHGEDHMTIDHVNESGEPESSNAKTTKMPVPFGNVYSFVDGKCNQSTGTPYFYGSYMDQTFTDISKNRAVSLTLSESAIPSVCPGSPIGSCTIAAEESGDPESPICARLVISGLLETIDSEKSPKEYKTARDALFQRHPSMANWPKGHNWVIAKINIKDLWFLDMYGGASILDVNKYYSVNLSSDEDAEIDLED